MRATLILFFSVFSAPAFAAAPVLPNHQHTPGVASPAVTASNYRTVLCRGHNSAYHSTDERRPGTAYTNSVKRKQLESWGYADKRLGDYEEDHLISLELGGSESGEKNLWPEPYTATWGARVKDTLEKELGRRICLSATDPDHLTLSAARKAAKGDWVTSYKRYVCNRHKPKLTAKMRKQCAPG